jgi:hypothetical protein
MYIEGTEFAIVGASESMGVRKVDGEYSDSLGGCRGEWYVSREVR